ncbi:SGNH/GDSL hydrolase family protein [Macrococcus armenti]|uniref:SGNH/GDSL hydrolase family protein n=1 Tax=Macrococcus armenti TaxID=2875764 RepID=A0ABY3ZYR2_9STAP|nr:SGNH/GDSL hydrolase family protein [Macrococcus armenti]UOB20138.1 hypothetical protein MRZ06_09040 [Macrococcus armenti]
MKNILFWIYILAAVLLIGAGYKYWQDKVTDGGEATEQTTETKHTQKDKSENSSQQEEKKDVSLPQVFKEPAIQKIYEDKASKNKKMQLTFVSTPYQTSDKNTNVANTFISNLQEDIDYNVVEIDASSNTVNSDDINKENPDIVILDALTLNDYIEGVTSDEHINNLDTIINNIKMDNRKIYVVGTRSMNDDAFNAYQQDEMNFLSNQDVYFIPVSDAIKENYDNDSELLTETGVKNWTKAITDEVLK